MPDGGASLFAAIGSALGTSGAAAGGTAAAAGSLGTAASAGVASGVTAGASGAAAAGLTTAEIAGLAASGASLTGTSAQLLSEKPKIEKPQASARDAAQEEADRLSSLYRKRGRGAALLTPGGAAGDTSSPNLGSAALLGA